MRLFMGILWNLLILVLMVASSSWHLAGLRMRLPSLQPLRFDGLDCVGLTTSHFRRGSFVVPIAMGASAR